MTFFKGNVHTHTARSDGDLDLEGVIAWYAARGYDWLAITDHNLGLDPARAEKLGAAHGILVIGQHGVAASIDGWRVRCRFPKDTAWLRARVFCSSGKYLWTQPVWR